MEEKYNIIKLSLARNFKYNVLYKLFQDGKSACEIVKNIDYVNKTLKNKIELPNDDVVEKTLQRAKELDIQIITFKDEEYPEYLKLTDSFPFVLYCKGNLRLFKASKTVAIIGSRNTSLNNFQYTKKISEEIGKYGYIVIAGMARGIDSAAHIGALKTGTIAVLGGGVNNIYPPENKQLYNDILENNGLIISEFPIDSPPIAEHFPQRNRIIAGLAKGVLIVDAGKRSGTLHTANQALKFGREVMAFPGNPYDEKYQGSNELLKNGATLVVCTEDILENLESFMMYFNLFDNKNIVYNQDEEKIKEQKFDFKNEEQKIVYDSIDDEILSKLDYSPIKLEQLVDMFNMDISSLLSILTKLELQDKIIMQNGQICLKLKI